jgi:hypothetical protein
VSRIRDNAEVLGHAYRRLVGDVRDGVFAPQAAEWLLDSTKGGLTCSHGPTDRSSLALLPSH